MNYREFIDTIYVLLSAIWEGEDFRFVMKRPNVHEGIKDVSMPIITYVLKEAKPGVVGQSGTIERKPRERNRYKRPTEDGEPEVVQVYGQIIDYYVEFTIYAQNNKEAMERSKDFAEAMDKYKGLLMKEGMQNMWFQREYERSGNEQRRDDMSTRGIDYLVRLENITEVSSSQIEKVGIEIETLRHELMKDGKLPSQQET